MSRFRREVGWIVESNQSMSRLVVCGVSMHFIGLPPIAPSRDGPYSPRLGATHRQSDAALFKSKDALWTDMPLRAGSFKSRTGNAESSGMPSTPTSSAVTHRCRISSSSTMSIGRAFVITAQVGYQCARRDCTKSSGNSISSEPSFSVKNDSGSWTNRCLTNPTTSRSGVTIKVPRQASSSSPRVRHVNISSPSSGGLTSGRRMSSGKLKTNLAAKSHASCAGALLSGLSGTSRR